MVPSVDGEPPRPALQVPVLDLAPLRALQGRSTPEGPLVTRILELFRDQAPRYVDDLRAAAAAADADRFRVAAHSLRSNAAAVGLQRLAEVCLEGERRTTPGSEPASSDDAPPDRLVHIAAAAATELRAGLAALGEAGLDGGSVRP